MMTCLYDKMRKPVAYLYQFAILEPGTYHLIGLMLGNCVFSMQGHLKGKMIGHQLLDESGAILAEEGQKTPNGHIDKSSLLEQVWNVLVNIRQHTLNFVHPSGKWADKPLAECLSGN
jgi:hypothetical protein